MIEFAKLPPDERITYFEEVANRRGLNKLIVEKDFWVSFTLQMLFSHSKLANILVFKGGTSLSKAFGIIKRFSEDIDLSLDPGWLGFDAENAPDKAPSRSQFDKRWKKMEEACISAVKDRIHPILKTTITEALRDGASGSGELNFQIDPQTGSPVLLFNYPTSEPENAGYMRPQVKLEFGSLTDQRPIGTHSVTSWVAEEFPELFENPGCEVVVLDVERSFWEKATILHAEFHRPAELPMRSRLSRDYYDVACLATHDTGRRALRNLPLLHRVVQHKRTYFRSSWANYEAAKPGSLKLLPPNFRMGDLKADYHAMKPMFFEKPPTFDELLNTIAKLEEAVNKF